MKYTKTMLNGTYTEEDFVFFWGHTPRQKAHPEEACLSQWWMSDFKDDAQRYCCAEQYMMYQKAVLFGDEEFASLILASRNQKDIKGYGRRVKNFNEEIWNQEKFSIVLRGNILKFSQNRELRRYLLSTRDKILVEASPYDKIWGIGMQRGNPELLEPAKWKGQNLLGFALMETRDFLQQYNAFAYLLQTSRNSGIPLEDAIHEAVQECKQRGIM